jgi:glycyl-tRNA synthetase alpha chain
VNFQDLVLALTHFWAERGVVVHQPYDLEMGAGTMHPETFFRVLGPEPWRVVYVQPSRRPADGRYGENPNRLYKHYQLQLILKPAPPNVQDLYLESLKVCGIDPRFHDIRFEEDNWESPALGAWGIGWQVVLDGLEITQFTYFQQSGGIDLAPISVEITYGLERLDMYLQGVDDVYDLEWAPGVNYREVRHRDEFEGSKYSFEAADVELARRHFEEHRREGERLLGEGLYVAAYEACLKCSHLFNILDARGALSVSERTAYLLKVRDLACRVAELYVESKAVTQNPDGLEQAVS